MCMHSSFVVGLGRDAAMALFPSPELVGAAAEPHPAPAEHLAGRPT